MIAETLKAQISLFNYCINFHAFSKPLTQQKKDYKKIVETITMNHKLNKVEFTACENFMGGKIAKSELVLNQLFTQQNIKELSTRKIIIHLAILYSN